MQGTVFFLAASDGISVLHIPGAIALIRTPCSAHSRTIDVCREFNAPLVIAYRTGDPCINAEPEEIFTIAPPFPPFFLTFFPVLACYKLKDPIRWFSSYQ